MRKKFLLLSFIISCSIVLFQNTKLAYSNKAGAIAGVTGSPHDVKTCSNGGVGCHGGTPTTLQGLITSDVPITGYIPGDTFTVTATASSPNLVRFGFEVSPQDVGGNLLGVLLISDVARMHFTGAGSKYITHTLTGSSAPTHVAVWSFNWVAPSSGTGDVTFYGAFNFANNNALSTGDTIHLSTLTIPENTDGVYEFGGISSMNVYPNPVTNELALSYYLQKPEDVQINLFDARGANVIQVFNKKQNGGAQKIAIDLNGKISSGIYLLQLKAGAQSLTKKVVKL